MKMVARATTLVSIGLVSMAIACGSDGNGDDGTGGSAGAGTGGSAGAGTGGTAGMAGSGGGGTSGVDPSKQLDEVTNAEAMTLCQELSDYSAMQLPRSLTDPSSCTVAALTIQMNMTEAACDQTVTDCIAAGAPAPEPPDCSAFMAGGTCTATVGETVACTQALIDATAAAFAMLQCSLAGADATTQVMNILDITLPTECDTVETKCPGTFM